MNCSDWKLAALLTVYNAVTFALAFGVGYLVSSVTGSLILALLGFAIAVRCMPRLDSLLRR